jgi:hypothetical protein
MSSEGSSKTEKKVVLLFATEDALWQSSTPSNGVTSRQILEFLLNSTCDAEVARHFFLKILTASHTNSPSVINIDKNAAYPKAFAEPKAGRDTLCSSCSLHYSCNTTLEMPTLYTGDMSDRRELIAI